MVCFCFIVIGYCSPLHAGDNQWIVETTYNEPGMDLFNPAFSPDGHRMAYVRQGHGPDGAEAEGMDEKTLDRHIAENAKREKETRFEEPKVIICSDGFKNGIEVGIGWNPCFSPDGSRLAFVKQVQPLAGMRTTTETMAGNSIELYDLKTKRSKIIAAPKKGALTDPFFSGNGNELFYLISNVLASDEMDSEGIVRVDLGNGSGTTLFAPQLKLKFPITLDNCTEDKGDVYAVLDIPLAANQDTVYQHRYDLVSLTKDSKTKYTWGEIDGLGMDFASLYHVFPNGQLLVYNKGWKKIDLTDGKVLDKPKGALEFKDCSLSPDGKYLIGYDEDGDRETVYVMEVGKIGKTKVLKLSVGDRVHEIEWSPNSNRVAIVITLSDYRDEIVISKRK